MVKLENVSFSYTPGKAIFQGFNWQAAHRERWAIIGPSGCGKTTLLYLLACLYLPARGNICIDNASLTGPRMSTGLILQDFGLLPWATVFDNTVVGLRIRRYNKIHSGRKAREWLLRLGIEGIAEKFPSEISGGERQRVAIARTLALEPDLLLMDEPFASLDALTREDLQNVVMSLWERLSCTLVLVTHNIEEAVLLSNRILVLRQPPNTEAVVIENPGSGTLLYRNTSQFSSICHILRSLLDTKAESEKMQTLRFYQ